MIFNYHLGIFSTENQMFKKSGIVRAAGLVIFLACAAFWTACIHRAPHYYDAYYNDYHKWNDNEVDHYHAWANETHRDPNREFRSLPSDEQEEYWKWRHTHEEPSHKKKRDKNPS